MGIVIARSAAFIINVFSGILLLGVCRRLVSFLSSLRIVRRMNLTGIHIHILWFYIVVFFSIIHVVSHVFNVQKLSRDVSWYVHPTILTGLCLIIALCLISMTVYFKESKFGVFKIFHVFFFVSFYILLGFHGSFCFIKVDNNFGGCLGASSWYFFTLPLGIFIVEKCLRGYARLCKVKIESIIYHPGDIMELRMEQSLYGIGDVIYINNPSFSNFQWNPFTITSVKGDKFMSVHIKKKRGFTLEFMQSEYPSIHIDGPFYSPEFDIITSSEISLIIACGIGITPFIGILKSILKDTKRIKRLYIVWIINDYSIFSILSSLIREIETNIELSSMVEFSLYWTIKSASANFCANAYINNNGRVDVITGFNRLTNYGRPRWDHILDKIENENMCERITVVYCGGDKLSKELRTKLKLKRMFRFFETSG
jgi:predicted ferric reductase